MVVLHRYFELYESPSISSIWKGLQISLYILGALTSIGASFCFGSFHYHYFDNNCILYSSVTFVKDASTNCHEKGCNSTILELPFGLIDHVSTIWDSDETCDFCIFSSVCSFIFSLVWATFFTMCGKGGRAVGGLPSSWRIVFPALVMNTTHFIISLVAASYLGNGMAVFCKMFLENMKEASCEIYKYDRSFKKHASLLLTLSKVFFWLTVVIWLFSIVLLLFRCSCSSDFELFKIEIITPTFQQQEAAKNAHESENVSKRASRSSSMHTSTKQQKDSSNARTVKIQGKNARDEEQVFDKSVLPKNGKDLLDVTLVTNETTDIFSESNVHDLARGYNQPQTKPKTNHDLLYNVVVHAAEKVEDMFKSVGAVTGLSAATSESLSLLANTGKHDDNGPNEDLNLQQRLQQSSISLNPAIISHTHSLQIPSVNKISSSNSDPSNSTTKDFDEQSFQSALSEMGNVYN